jgi:hypothetical protein
MGLKRSLLELIQSSMSIRQAVNFIVVANVAGQCGEMELKVTTCILVQLMSMPCNDLTEFNRV